MSQQNPYQAPAAQFEGGQPTHREDPGKVLGILSLVFIVLFPLVGAILGFIGRKKSREAGFDGQLGNIGFIINTVLTVLGLIWIVVIFIAALSSPSTTSSALLLPALGLL